jgi:ribose-phosphate pyrophosphokinase
VQGFFRIPVDHLNATPIVCDHLRATSNLRDSVLIASDVGEAKDLAEYANRLKLPMAIIDKRRHDDSENPVAVGLIGSVTGKSALIIGDEIASGGTMIAAAQFLLARGATGIEAAAVHPVLSGRSVERLKDSPIKRLVVTNSIPLGEAKRDDRIEVVSVAGLFADAIRAIHSGESVSKLFA